MTKLRCAVLDDYQDVALSMADWSTLADRVEVTSFHQHYDDEGELVRAISDFDIVVLMRERTRFGETLLARLPRLKLLVTTGMRNAAIDVAAATARGVVVSGTASSSEPPTELTWALILGLARNVVEENHSLRTNGPWQRSVGADLYRKQLGILGLGKIGSRVARVGLAFGMQVAAWSKNLTAERADAAGVRLASSLEEILEGSDFVTIHLVLGQRTRDLIGARELRMMRPSAYLINTSRAPIVNQSALVEAVQKGWIAGVGIDVFDEEPLPEDHVFRSLPNVLATPHLGYVTWQNYLTYYREVVEDIAAFLNDEPARRLA
ncbi:MAG TPA: D-2-hydroxyacid dehydrogenase family protein [Pyrinomonadaceae bacterium]